MKVKGHKLLTIIGRLVVETDEALEMSAELMQERDELLAQIGEPPAGSHPDEAGPRAATWHAERANWAAEVTGLREQNHILRDRLSDLERPTDPFGDGLHGGFPSVGEHAMRPPAPPAGVHPDNLTGTHV